MGNRIHVGDFRSAARRRLPRFVFDYIDGGCEDEKGLAYNRQRLEAMRFVPRRLRDVSHVSLEIELDGRVLPSPILAAPTGLNGLIWPNGDLALARVAARRGMPFILSTASNASIEEVAEASSGELWFQLYVLERALAGRLVQRAADARYSTLVLTVDVPENGKRERDVRNGFAMPMRPSLRTALDLVRHPAWAAGIVRHGVPRMANLLDGGADRSGQVALLKRRMDATFSLADLAWLRDRWPGRLLVKGVLDPEDAVECVRHGADGLILSNHGGRQLDACVSPLDTLEAVVSRVSCPVLVDSGFRRGSDIVKALALGARAVLVGRAPLYGLAAHGEAGAAEVMALLDEETRLTLVQLGCRSVHELSGAVIHA